MKNTLYSLLALSSLVINPAFAAGGGHHDHHNHGEHTGQDSPFYGHFHAKIHADSIIDAEEEFDEIYSHSHLELGARLGHGFSINSNIKLEGEASGHDHGHGGSSSTTEEGNRFFDDHPLVVEQLTLNYDSQNFSAYAGKFKPTVGFDYHKFPGAYGYQTIEEYAISERIGFGAALKHDAGDYGRHRLDVSTFFADTTALSDSILYQRGHTTKRDGGLANTEDLSSFAVSLGGSDFYSLNNNFVEGLSYRFGYAKQAAGLGNERDEKRYSASLSYNYQILQNLSALFIGEHMDIKHLDGEAAHDRAYSTLALRLDYHGWNIATSYTHINNDAEEADENKDGNVSQISAGYRFDNGLGIDVGYQRRDEESEVTNRIGMLVSYHFSF